MKLKTQTIFDGGERTETADTNNGKNLFKTSTITKKKSMPVHSQSMFVGTTLSIFKDKASTIAQQSLKIVQLLQDNSMDFATINAELEKDKIYPSCKVVG